MGLDVLILIVMDVRDFVKNMKWSARNKIVLNSHGGLLYIGNSCSLVKLSFRQIFSIVLYILSKNEKCLKKSDFQLLKSLGAILDDDKIVLNSFKMLENKFRAANRVYDITICISESCNFSCRYCYENAKDKKRIISNKTIDQLIEYLNRQKETFSSINVTLYGGEPLLSKERIFYLHNKLQLLDKKIVYSMITNGYLLTLESYKELQKLPINKYQITIDGFQQNHNKNRPHKHDIDSYSTILKNLSEIYNYCKNSNIQSNITIRVDIDKCNEKSFVTFYKFICEKFSKNYPIYSAFIENYSDKNDLDLLSKKDKIKFCLNNFENRIYENRYLPHIYNRTNYCCATLSKSIVMDANGNVYKCWSDIGLKNKVIFNINNPQKVNLNLESKYYIVSDPLYDKKCEHCFLLFSCYGGCPRDVIDKKVRNCELAKYKPKQFLETIYNRRNKSYEN